MSDPNEIFIRRAAKDILAANYAIALTGAGISTESGIPDFRGPDGVWTLNPEAEKRAYEAYGKLVADPKGWWEEILNGPIDPLLEWRKASPNQGHLALVDLETMGLLKSTITQNVDGLHEKAGTKNLFEYHGSTNWFRCMACQKRYRLDDVDLDELKETGQLPPLCRACGNPLKSDIVFFGEPIPMEVARQSEQEAVRCDLMLICGTSAVVYPFAGLPTIARFGVPDSLVGVREYQKSKSKVTIIEVNTQPTPLTEEGISDYLICGRTGDILPRIVAAIKN